MTNKIVPVIISSTKEVVGTASISPPDKDGKIYASIVKLSTIINYLKNIKELLRY